MREMLKPDPRKAKPRH